MSTESLIVELDAKTQKLDAKLKATTKRLDELDGGVKKTDSSLLKMGKVAGVAGEVLIKTAAAAAALSAAVTAMVVGSAKGRRELELLSTQAKTSVEDFQALSFATGQYGINAEQIADISKDVSDKVGEFARDATGPFQDFANQMRLTKSQAKDLAVEFQGLSSEQVIGRMVKMMEEADTSGDQMTQVLESMGNDLSKLKPLFSDNAKELEKLKDGFNAVNESLQITDLQAEKLQKVSQSYDLMTSAIGNATTAISATLAPVMDDFFNDVIEIVPTATQAIIDFANSFLEAENISSLAGVKKEITDTEAEIKKLALAHKIVNQAIEEQNTLFFANDRNQKLISDADKFNQEQERLAGLLDRQNELLAEKKQLEDASKLEGGQIGGETGETIKKEGDTGLGDLQSKELEAIKDRFKTEEELILKKAELEKQVIMSEVESKVERDNLLLALTAETEEKLAALKAGRLDPILDRFKTEEELILEKYNLEVELIEKEIELKTERDEALLNLATKTGDKLLAVKEKQFKEEEKLKLAQQKKQDKLDKIVEKQDKENAERNDKMAKDGMALASVVFEDNKEVASGIAFVNTAQGITKALSAQDYVGATLTATMGVAQIAAINSASKGGGSAPAVSAPTQTSQESFTPETSSLELSEVSEDSVQTINVVFSTDDGNQFFDMVGQSVAENSRQGRQ